MANLVTMLPVVKKFALTKKDHFTAPRGRSDGQSGRHFRHSPPLFSYRNSETGSKKQKRRGNEFVSSEEEDPRKLQAQGTKKLFLEFGLLLISFWGGGTYLVFPILANPI